VFLPIGPDFVLGPRDFNFKCAYGWIPVKRSRSLRRSGSRGTTGCSGFRFHERRNEEDQPNDNTV
jgi:hypothetical protein